MKYFRAGRRMWLEIFSRWGYRVLLGLILVLSFGLNFFAISKVGYGNAYYAAAIKSMTESFHNFFYVSFDPAGVVSVDKPPLALWIQALFVLALGYHGWAMLLPQALAATASCLLLYLLTARHFGRPAGLISALVLALTPAVVVAARNNTMDMELVLALLAATWFLFRAVETSRWRWLFTAAAFVGIAFNIKMLEAYMILPAMAVFYLLYSKQKFLKRMVGCLISLAICAAVSFAWVAAVDLAPVSSRPYVGSSTNNTELELIIGHNGMERLVGSGGGVGGRSLGGNNGSFGFRGRGSWNGGTAGKNAADRTSSDANGSNAQNSGNFAGGPNGNGGPGGNFGGGNGGSSSRFTRRGPFTNMGGFAGGGAGNDIGTAGVFRMWESSVYGQASWLFLLLPFCFVAMLRRRKNRMRAWNLQQGIAIYWAVWFVTLLVFFSFAGFWHRYYLCFFAPAIAGLAGPGIVNMVKDFRLRRRIRQALLPTALLCTAGFQLYYVWSYSQLRAWLVPVIAGAAALSLILMTLHFIVPHKLVLRAAAGLMLVSILAAPLYWALTVVLYVPQNSTMPYAGPELASTTEVRGMTPNQEVLTTGDSSTRSLEKYLVTHYKKSAYLVVSQRADDVAQFIVDTGLPAVATGGFLGSDNAITLTQFKQLVSEGKIRYYLLTSGSFGGNSEISSYVKENATLIPSSEYGAAESPSRGFSSRGVSGSSLYLFK